MDICKEKVKSEITVDHVIPVEILDDLSSRFIINVPQEERKDLVRICFQIELAHWFYLDFYCTEENAKLKPCGMKEFTTHIFQHIPSLKPYSKEVDTVLEEWKEYKQAVPTFGAILLNEEMSHVLLVQSYWARSSWGFPKGKVNKEEDPTKCAVREVMEETGFDISKRIDPNEYIESTVNEQVIRLYIITGIQMDIKFQPLTRNEIKAVEWFMLSDLPNNKKDMTPKLKMGVGPNSFFMVVPFIKRLKRWVLEKQLKAAQGPVRRFRHKSMGDAESAATYPNSNYVNVNNNTGNGGAVNQFQKQRKQQQFTHGIQLDQEVQLAHSMKNMSLASPPPRNNRPRHDKERKSTFKRKLNFNSQEVDNIQKSRIFTAARSKTPQQQNNVYANSWLNFRFDRGNILAAFCVAN